MVPHNIISIVLQLHLFTFFTESIVHFIRQSLFMLPHLSTLNLCLTALYMYVYFTTFHLRYFFCVLYNLPHSTTDCCIIPPLITRRTLCSKINNDYWVFGYYYSTKCVLYLETNSTCQNRTTNLHSWITN